MALIKSTAIPSGATDYELEQSLKFNDDDNTQLERTFTSAGDRKKWTWSAWIKRGNIATNMTLFSAKGNTGMIWLAGVDGVMRVEHYNGAGGYDFRRDFDGYHRDASAWYHFIIVYDSAQGSEVDRIKFYRNGEAVGVDNTANAMTQNFQSAFNSNETHWLGAINHSFDYDGYMAEVNFVDGQTLTPADFGETGTYGEWKPIEYSGTYGTNGFYLPFKQDYTVEGFSTVTWKGTGGTTAYVGGTGFQPDLVWMKTRTNSANHAIWDSVRGVHKGLSTSATTAEITDSYGLEEFRPDGFETRENVSAAGHSNSGNMVAWNWDMGGSNATNNDGSYTSTVRANTAYGQSIVSYDATKVTNATVGHGLNSTPEMIIAKGREEAYDWIVYHKDLNGGTNPHTKRLRLNSNAGESANDNWGNAQPTSDVFTLGADETINPTNSKGVIAYCFHSVTGYSKIGSYTGNGSNTGTVVTTGFRPAFLLIKNTAATGSWYLYDSVREPADSKGQPLYPNNSNGNTSYYERLKFTDTGFQLLHTDTDLNGNGTNYIYMAFADKREYAYWLDQSGNNNDWTSNNLTESDISVDSPTNNFCTMNPLSPNTSGLTFSEGNLKMAGADIGFFGTMGVSSGKWYYEMHSTNASGNSLNTSAVGIVHSDALHDTVDSSSNNGFQLFGGTNKARGYYGYAGNKLDGDSNDSYGAAFVTGDVIGVALNLEDGEITFYKNNVSQGVAFTSLGSGEWFPLWQNWTSSVGVMNFGQDSSFSGIKTAQGNQDGNDIGDFYYTPPTGFLALCTKNLPDVAVTPSEHFNTVLYTGNSTSGRAINGVGFQPDFVWFKARSGSEPHFVVDAVRGAKRLLPNTDVAEANATITFETDGVTVGTNSSNNDNNVPYVAWNWKANGSGSSNTDGSVTTTVSADVDAGFSIATYTGTGSSATFGHGLSKAPEISFYKIRSQGYQWMVYTGNTLSTNGLVLNGTDAGYNAGGTYGTHGASTFALLTNADVNGSGQTYVSYHFHSVDGYSKVGSYTGNGNADGTFVYTGFKPAFVMVKRTDATEGWTMVDNERVGYNPDTRFLYPNESSAEETLSGRFDIVSNGFKMRNSWSKINTSGGTYIYLAFAETPFKYSNAR